MIDSLFRRKTTGSVVCPSCGSLVGVRDDRCYMCGRSNPGLWGYAPALRQLGADFGFVPLVIGASSILYVLTLLMSGPGGIRMDGLMAFLAPSTEALFLFGASGAIPVFAAGRWWTVLSAGWLHAGLLHILFNMYYVRLFGPATVDVVGPARTIIIYVVSGACGFLLSSVAGAFLGGIPIPFLRGAGFTVGASAPVFGLLGALVHYGRTSSSFVKQQTIPYVVMFAVFGLIMPGVDNYAHAGGFVGGYAASAFMNPLTRERGDHMVVAVVCLAGTVLAVIVSVVTGLRLLR
jgi:rhomboid protease GluP